MRRESIFFTITVSFIISIFLVIISFSIIINTGQMRKDIHLQKKYIPMVKMFMKKYRHSGITTDLKKNLEVMNMEIMVDEKMINNLVYNSDTEVLIESKFSRAYIQILHLNNTNYVYIKKRHNTFLLKDNNTIVHHKKQVVFIVFGIILITLIVSFLTTIRKLYPLKILKDKVTTMADEKFDFDCCDTTKKDEVSLLALEFKNTADKLHRLKESRNIFIRNIMHELKTPITKGKFLVELDDSKKNSEKLKKVFNKLESLINEFASIEELISQSSKSLEKKEYFLEDVVEEAVDTLMLEDDILENKTDNIKVLVHFKLFSIAIKNLIDNAVKYSSDDKVIISTNEETITIENVGNRLKNELETYFEPFSKDENKTNDSFGLGLYIVHNILKANDYVLEYEYSKGINKFKCVKVKKIDI